MAGGVWEVSTRSWAVAAAAVIGCVLFWEFLVEAQWLVPSNRPEESADSAGAQAVVAAAIVDPAWPQSKNSAVPTVTTVTTVPTALKPQPPAPMPEQWPHPGAPIAAAPRGDAADLALPPDRALGPLALDCCTCTAEPLAEATAPPAQMTGCEVCGRWVARPGTPSASHISTSGVISSSATALRSTVGDGKWLWLEGASFYSKQAPCLQRWEQGDSALRCLTKGGRRIMFEGDSFVRNAFMGLLLLLRGSATDGIGSLRFAYPASKWLAGKFKADGVNAGKAGEYTDELLNGFNGANSVSADPTPLTSQDDNAGSAAEGKGGWVRYYNNAYSMARMGVLKGQVAKLQPDVLVVGLPGIHDHIARTSADGAAVRADQLP